MHCRQEIPIYYIDRDGAPILDHRAPCPFASEFGEHPSLKNECLVHGDRVVGESPVLFRAKKDLCKVCKLIPIQNDLFQVSRIRLSATDFQALFHHASKSGSKIFLDECTISGTLYLANIYENIYVYMKNCEIDHIQIKNSRISGAKTIINSKIKSLYIENSIIDARSVLEGNDLSSIILKESNIIEPCDISFSNIGLFDIRNSDIQELAICDSSFSDMSVITETNFDQSLILDNLFCHATLHVTKNVFRDGFAMGVSQYSLASQDLWYVDPPKIRFTKNMELSLFRENVFIGVADFKNRVFQDTVDFSGSTFHKAPRFHNAQLHQDSSFDRVKFLDVLSETAAQDYRVLRLQMENVRARQEEGRFFALEQRSLRKSQKTKLSDRTLSLIYDYISDYGNSIFRPIVWFLVTNLTISTFLAYNLGLPTNLSGLDMRFLEFSLSQTFNPFAAVRNPEIYKPIYQIEFSLGIQILSLFQGIINLTLLTCVIIALRRRYRIS